MSTSSDPRRVEALAYLETVFGDRRGHLRFAFGVGGYFNEESKFKHKKWEERHGLWPDDRDRFLDEALSRFERDDVYLCPYLGSTHKREQGSALPSHVLYADDANATDPRWMVIDSGGGKPDSLHVYALLTEDLPSAQLMAGNRRMRAAVGGDSKVSDNDVLRLPGSTNHKTGNAVRLVQAGTSAALDALCLPRDPSPPRAMQGTTKPSAASPTADLDPRKLPPLIRLRLNEHPDGDRSRQTASFVRDCIEDGLSEEDTIAAVLQHRPTLERGKSRGWIVKDVRRLLGKAER